MGKFSYFFGSIFTAFGCLGTWLGFSTTGVTAGSWAAFFQSLIGNVAPGSLFAILTSWGMKGVFALSSGLGIIILSFGILTSLFNSKEEKKEKTFIETLSPFYNDSKKKSFSFFEKTKKKSAPYIFSAKEKATGFFNSLFND